MFQSPPTKWITNSAVLSPSHPPQSPWGRSTPAVGRPPSSPAPWNSPRACEARHGWKIPTNGDKVDEVLDVLRGKYGKVIRGIEENVWKTIWNILELVMFYNITWKKDSFCIYRCSLRIMRIQPGKATKKNPANQVWIPKGGQSMCVKDMRQPERMLCHKTKPSIPSGNST